MNKNDFYHYAEQIAKDYFDTGYGFSTEKIDKLNDSYMGLKVWKNAGQGVDITPILNLDRLYQISLETGDPDKVIREAFKDALSGVEEATKIAADVNDYERIREKLFIRLSPIDGNGDALKGIPHKTVCDLAMTFHVLCGENPDDFSQYSITNGLLEIYGISEDQLYADAMMNSMKLLPISVMSLDKIVEGYERSKSGPTVVSNSKNIFGAAAVLYPGVLEKLTVRMEGSYYLLPSSVHEWIVIRDDGFVDAEGLADFVKSVNTEHIAKEERLSDHVYHYDKNSGRFEIAA